MSIYGTYCYTSDGLRVNTVDFKKLKFRISFAGEHNLKVESSYEQLFNFSELLIHPKYDTKNFDYDLALVRLNKKASLNSRVRTACLPGHQTSFSYGTECYIAGWGLLSDYGVGPAVSLLVIIHCYHILLSSFHVF